MNKFLFFNFIVLSIVTSSCNKNQIEDYVQIPEFNFTKTIVFEDSLSAYNIFQGNPVDLIPDNDFTLLELSSVLFTDYAYKQRLVKIPSGTQITRETDGSLNFPNGTVLTKTFYYYENEDETAQGKRIIETRLLIKESNTWNAATYIWNNSQTNAVIELKGASKTITWTNSIGSIKSIKYKVPTENECMTCHQSNGAMAPIGPTIMNLNKMVDRNGVLINQLDHLQNLGFLDNFDHSEEIEMVDYKDPSNPINERGRAYLDINCAHCHNPAAWSIPAEKNFDFRYETSLDATGIFSGKDRIIKMMIDQEMPFIGTTTLDREGLDLLNEYLENL